MTTIQVEGQLRHPVHVGALALADVAACVQGERFVLVTDTTVGPLWANALALGPAPRHDLPPSDDAKSLRKLGELLDFLARSSLDRRSCIVALGGGGVTDVCGFAASVYKRGIDVVHVPTTLLGQVDAAIGGKTAINLGAGKNLAGTFHAPRAVFCDPRPLATLPDEELASGFGEVVKTALIEGDAALAAVEERASALRARDPDALSEIVAACVRTKARFVAADPYDRGDRRALNLGHTFGHAIEHVAGFGVVPHGVAVAVGLVLALEASLAQGLLEDAALPERVARLLATLGLPRSLAELPVPIDPSALRAGFAHDKKGAVGRPEFVLVRRAGSLALGVVLAEPE